MSAYHNSILLCCCLLLAFFCPNTSKAQNVVKVEYFLDADPGFGKGSNVPITTGADITTAFQININSLEPGFHNLYIRAYVNPYQVTEDNKTVIKGGWSLTGVRNFFKESFVTGSLLPIVKGEYFIDTDPGLGGGSNITIIPGTDLTAIAFTADISQISKGFHRLYARYRDANGKWSPTNTRAFYKEDLSVEPLSNITGLEYFIDTDPGFAKGKKVTITPGTDIKNLVFTIDMAIVSVGNHQMYVRALNANGVWSLSSTGSFKVDPPSPLHIIVGTIAGTFCAGSSVAVPFSVNAPFGSNNTFKAQLSNSSGSFSNPVDIGSLSGNKSDTVKATIPANTAGGNAYRMRIIASSPNDTSAPNSTALTISRVPEQSFTINGKSNTCLGSETYYASNGEQGISYTWNVSGGGTIPNKNGDTIKIEWTIAGNYLLKATPSNVCGTGSARTLQVTVFSGPPTLTPTITANNQILQAAVASTENGVTGYQWYKDGIAISGAINSSYNVIEDGSYTVRYTNSCGNGPVFRKRAEDGFRNCDTVKQLTERSGPKRVLVPNPYKLNGLLQTI